MLNYKKIAEVLNKWEDLTGKETKAIQSNDWNTVSVCQNAKLELKKQLSQELPDGYAQGVQPESTNDLQWEQILNKGKKLIELERENELIIQSFIGNAIKEQQMLSKNIKDLHKVRSAYGSKNLPAWQTYT